MKKFMRSACAKREREPTRPELEPVRGHTKMRVSKSFERRAHDSDSMAQNSLRAHESSVEDARLEYGKILADSNSSRLYSLEVEIKEHTNSTLNDCLSLSRLV